MQQHPVYDYPDLNDIGLCNTEFDDDGLCLAELDDAFLVFVTIEPSGTANYALATSSTFQNSLFPTCVVLPDELAN